METWSTLINRFDKILIGASKIHKKIYWKLESPPFERLYISGPISVS